MTNATIPLILIILAALSFNLTRQRSITLVGGNRALLHSLPRHYGYVSAMWVLIPGLATFSLWLLLGERVIDGLIVQGLRSDIGASADENIRLLLNRVHLVFEYGPNQEIDPNIITAAERYENLYDRGLWTALLLSALTSVTGFFYTWQKTKPSYRARSVFENAILTLLVVSSIIAIATTLGIILSLFFESLLFFQQVPLDEFLFGTKWSPQTALRVDQIGSSGAFGALPLFAGTFLITILSMLVAGPIGLFSAIYMTQYAGKKTRAVIKPALEILAGIPTVVYGFFAAVTISPAFKTLGDFTGIEVASESALAAGIVMGIMIIPLVSSLSDDALNAVPQELKEASLALGATPSETILKVLIPAAFPGIIAAFLLAASRAIGETMIVVMAAGIQSNITANPFEAVTTVTVQIVSLLTGDQEFDSTKTLSAFALGLVLFIITMLLNVVAIRVVRRYRRIYE
jgi:phosphate transport system permease protein